MLINPKIVEIFKKTKNIQRTALEAGVSVVTVRRTLLTVGEYSNGLVSQFGVKHHFYRGIEAVQIAMKYRSLHYFHHFSQNFIFSS